MTRRTTATIRLSLTYDAWKDLESALLDRALKAENPHMKDRLNAIRLDIQSQVFEQRPRW